MLKRATQALIATVVIAASAAGSASAAGFDTNHGKPADPVQSSCAAVVSNGGAQAGFVRGVGSEGPGAVGDANREFGTSGGAGGAVPHNCS
jgi:hypothetical protein